MDSNSSRLLPFEDYIDAHHGNVLSFHIHLHFDVHRSHDDSYDPNTAVLRSNHKVVYLIPTYITHAVNCKICMRHAHLVRRETDENQIFHNYHILLSKTHLCV